MTDDFKRLQNIAKLWLLGIMTLGFFFLSLIGANSLGQYILEAYGWAWLLGGAIITPIIIALFILPPWFREIWGAE